MSEETVTVPAKSPTAKPRTKKSTEEVEAAKAQAQAGLESLNEELEQETAVDFNAPRKKRGGANTTFSPDYSMPLAEYVPGLDIELFGPTAFAAVRHGPVTGSTGSQEFTLDEDRATYLCFTPAGQNLPKKRLYTIKGFHRDGRLVQLPFELQIQNTAGGDMADMIGLRRYQRKGIHVLIDWNTGQPLYCAAWGCFAKADGRTGFCSQRHAAHTLPNRFKDAGEIISGVFGTGATTSSTARPQVWADR